MQAQLCTLVDQMETLHAAVNDLLYGLTGVWDPSMPDDKLAAAAPEVVSLCMDGAHPHIVAPAARAGASSMGSLVHSPLSAAAARPISGSFPWLVRTTEDGRSIHSRRLMPVLFPRHSLQGPARGDKSATSPDQATYAEVLFDAQHPKNTTNALGNFTD